MDCFVALLLAMTVETTDVARTALSPPCRQRPPPRSSRRGVDDVCNSEGAGRRLRLRARAVSHPAHDHGRRGSTAFLFDLLRTRRRRTAHRGEEGRWRRVLELGLRRIEGR